MIDPRPYGIIGHRGARGLFPENTLEGFLKALALGVRAIEMDVALTADGVAVVVHDPRPNADIAREGGRWLDISGLPFRERTLASLEGFDMGRLRPGSALAGAFPDQVPYDGARLPTLAQALCVLLAAGATGWIELKTLPPPVGPGVSTSPKEMVDAIVAVVRELKAEQSVVIQSFDWRCQRAVRATAPELRLAWLTRDADLASWPMWFDQSDAADPIAAVASNGGTIWTPEYTDITPERIARARRVGIEIVAWTVNEPGDMRRLAAWGVNGIITDRPDRALSKETS